MQEFLRTKLRGLEFKAKLIREKAKFEKGACSSESKVNLIEP